MTVHLCTQWTLLEKLWAATTPPNHRMSLFHPIYFSYMWWKLQENNHVNSECFGGEYTVFPLLCLLGLTSMSRLFRVSFKLFSKLRRMFHEILVSFKLTWKGNELVSSWEPGKVDVSSTVERIQPSNKHRHFSYSDVTKTKFPLRSMFRVRLAAIGWDLRGASSGPSYQCAASPQFLLGNEVIWRICRKDFLKHKSLSSVIFL